MPYDADPSTALTYLARIAGRKKRARAWLARSFEGHRLEELRRRESSSWPKKRLPCPYLEAAERARADIDAKLLVEVVARMGVLDEAS